MPSPRVATPPEAAVPLPAADGSTGEVELGSYKLRQTLSPGRGYLAAGPGGRDVVLKLLQADCLLKGQLHPSIKERLARVRELPERTVANLHGVEKDKGHAYLVWDYVEGLSLSEYVREAGRSHRDVAKLARELVLAVESLHVAGIVHGAIHGNNVIVDPLHQVRLTHVSPLLYSDPAQDVAAVLKVLRDLIETRGETATPLGVALAEMRATPNLTATELAGRLVALREQSAVDVKRPAAAAEPPVAKGEPHFRRRALVAAAGAALAGAAVVVGVWKSQQAGPDDPYGQRTPISQPPRSP